MNKLWLLLFVFVGCNCATTVPVTVEEPKPDYSFVLKNKSGEPMVWNEFIDTVEVYVDTNLNEAILDAYYAAADEWNLALRRKAIKIVQVPSNHTVLLDITPEAGTCGTIWLPQKLVNNQHIALAITDFYIYKEKYQYEKPTIYSCYITFSYLMPPEYLYSTILHEFGHVLMLDDVDNPDSVMHYISGTPGEEANRRILPKHIEYINLNL